MSGQSWFARCLHAIDDAVRQSFKEREDRNDMAFQVQSNAEIVLLCGVSEAETLPGAYAKHCGTVQTGEGDAHPND